MLDKGQMLAMLARLGETIKTFGVSVDVVVSSNCALMLESNFRQSTQFFVGYLVDTLQADLFDLAVREVVRQHKTPIYMSRLYSYASSYVGGYESLDYSRDFPFKKENGIRVLVPEIEYMLAMKLRMLRSTSADEQDMRDAVRLTAIFNPAGIEEFTKTVTRFYALPDLENGGPSSIPTVWQEYEKFVAAKPAQTLTYLKHSYIPR